MTNYLKQKNMKEEQKLVVKNRDVQVQEIIRNVDKNKNAKLIGIKIVLNIKTVQTQKL